MKDKKLNLLKKLTDANGVPGNETQVRNIMKNELENIADSIKTGKLGSFIAFKKSNKNSPKVMIDGHMDEVGMMVKKIDDNGFIKFQTLGGWWGHVMLGQEFNITTEQKNIITGIIGSTPPHLLENGSRDKVIKPDKMFLDIGVKNKEEAEFLGIKIGDMITPKSEFKQLGNLNYLKAKAFDNRIGCGIGVEVMKNFKDYCPVDLYTVGSVQEEVGLRGAKTTASKIKPDVAFVVDLTFSGDTPGLSDIEPKLGDGPVIVLMDATHIGNKNLKNLAVNMAEKLGLNYKFEIMNKGGTDAGRIHMVGEGIPTLGLAIASRYMHSHNTIIHYEDYKNLIKLLTEMCKNINWDFVNKLND